MAKDSSHYQQGIVKRYYKHHDTIQSNKLSELVSELWLAEGTKEKQKLWGKAQVALMRIGVNANVVAKICGGQDMEELAKLVAKADAGTAFGETGSKENASGATATKDKAHGTRSMADGRTIKEMRAQRAADGGFDSLEEYNLKRALKKFRKKLKTLRRDDESKLGNRYVTYGRISTISAITPPNEYPAPVWEKLVELGRLRKAGQGTYELPGQV